MRQCAPQDPTRRRSSFPAQPDAEIDATGTSSESSTALATQTIPGPDSSYSYAIPLARARRSCCLSTSALRIVRGPTATSPAAIALLDHRWIRCGEQSFAHAGRMGGQPAADLRRQAGRVLAMEYLDVDHLGAVQHGEVDGLTGRFAQISHERERHLADRTPPGGALPPLEHLQSQPDLLVLALQKSGFLHFLHQPGHGGFR